MMQLTDPKSAVTTIIRRNELGGEDTTFFKTLDHRSTWLVTARNRMNWEGNVFSRVCQPGAPYLMMHWGSLILWYVTVRGPYPMMHWGSLILWYVTVRGPYPMMHWGSLILWYVTVRDPYLMMHWVATIPGFFATAPPPLQTSLYYFPLLWRPLSRAPWYLPLPCTRASILNKFEHL